MKFSEAARLLEEGKRIRKKSWDECCYIYIGDDGTLLDEDDFDFEVYSIIGDWEEYIEGKDIDVATKIEELDYVINDAYGNEVYDITTLKSHARKNRDKINEIIKYINSKEE